MIAKLKPTTPAEFVYKADFLVNRMNGRLDKNLKMSKNVLNLLSKIPEVARTTEEVDLRNKAVVVAKELKLKIREIYNNPKLVDEALTEVNRINAYIYSRKPSYDSIH